MHKVLVNCLVKLAEEKYVLRGTNSPNMTIVVDWDIKLQTKPKNLSAVGDLMHCCSRMKAEDNHSTFVCLI